MGVRTSCLAGVVTGVGCGRLDTEFRLVIRVLWGLTPRELGPNNFLTAESGVVNIATWHEALLSTSVLRL